jgi:hypothetical protein
MRTLLLASLMLLGRIASAEPARPVELTLAAGVATSSLGDWNRSGESLRARIAHRWTPWLDTGIDAHIVRGQGVLGLTARGSLGRAYVRGGVGLDTGWHNSMTHAALSPVVLAAVGAELFETSTYAIALELGGFAGNGNGDSVFPDERIGVALDAAVRF